MASLSAAQAARQGLADRLREIRTGAGFNGIELAEATGIARTKISRIEHGRTWPTATEIRTWCRACDVEDLAEELVAMLVATDTMWTEWRRMERAGLRQAQESVVPLWERTRHFRIYSPWLIPGPVQAEPYIRALLDARRARHGLADDVDEAVAVRVAKQHVVRKPGRRFAILLEEAALRYRIGGPDVLRAQLAHLLTVMTLPSISLGIVPQDADRSVLRPVEMFFVFDEEQVAAEFVSGALSLTTPSEVRAYADTFELLAEMAVYGAEARVQICAALDALG